MANKTETARRTAQGIFQSWEDRKTLVKQEMDAERAASDAKTIRLKAHAPGEGSRRRRSRPHCRRECPAQAGQDQAPPSPLSDPWPFSRSRIAPNISTASPSASARTG